MATTSNYHAVGQGKVYIASRDTTGRTSGFVWMGDADGFEVTGSQNFLDWQESYSGNRARVGHLPTSTNLGFKLNLKNIDTDNVAKAFYGTKTSGTGASVSGEALSAYANSMIPLANPGVSSVVVTKTAGTLVLTAGTDYTVDAANGTITFLPGSAAVTGTSAVPCTVSYTFASYEGKVQFLADSVKDYILRFEGKSQFDGKAKVYQLHRANFNLATALQLIGSDVASLALEGAVLAAPEITVGSPFGTGLHV
jgi:hypothetical protein